MDCPEARSYVQEMAGQLTCSLCHELFKNPHTFSTCSCTFCHDCVAATLEGPGITESRCPDCHQPGWKKDLRQNHMLAGLATILRRLLQNAQGAGGALTAPVPSKAVVHSQDQAVVPAAEEPVESGSFGAHRAAATPQSSTCQRQQRRPDATSQPANCLDAQARGREHSADSSSAEGSKAPDAVLQHPAVCPQPGSACMPQTRSTSQSSDGADPSIDAEPAAQALPPPAEPAQSAEHAGSPGTGAEQDADDSQHPMAVTGTLWDCSLVPGPAAADVAAERPNSGPCEPALVGSMTSPAYPAAVPGNATGQRRTSHSGDSHRPQSPGSAQRLALVGASANELQRDGVAHAAGDLKAASADSSAQHTGPASPLPTHAAPDQALGKGSGDVAGPAAVSLSALSTPEVIAAFGSSWQEQALGWPTPGTPEGLDLPAQISWLEDQIRTHGALLAARGMIQPQRLFAAEAQRPDAIPAAIPGMAASPGLAVQQAVDAATAAQQGQRAGRAGANGEQEAHPHRPSDAAAAPDAIDCCKDGQPHVPPAPVLAGKAMHGTAPDTLHAMPGSQIHADALPPAAANHVSTASWEVCPPSCVTAGMIGTDRSLADIDAAMRAHGFRFSPTQQMSDKSPETQSAVRAAAHSARQDSPALSTSGRAALPDGLPTSVPEAAETDAQHDQPAAPPATAAVAALPGDCAEAPAGPEACATTHESVQVNPDLGLRSSRIRPHEVVPDSQDVGPTDHAAQHDNLESRTAAGLVPITGQFVACEQMHAVGGDGFDNTHMTAPPQRQAQQQPSAGQSAPYVAVQQPQGMVRAAADDSPQHVGAEHQAPQLGMLKPALVGSTASAGSGRHADGPPLQAARKRTKHRHSRSSPRSDATPHSSAHAPMRSGHMSVVGPPADAAAELAQHAATDPGGHPTPPPAAVPVSGSDPIRESPCVTKEADKLPPMAAVTAAGFKSARRRRRPQLAAQEAERSAQAEAAQLAVLDSSDDDFVQKTKKLRRPNDAATAGKGTGKGLDIDAGPAESLAVRGFQAELPEGKAYERLRVSSPPPEQPAHAVHAGPAAPHGAQQPAPRSEPPAKRLRKPYGMPAGPQPVQRGSTASPERAKQRSPPSPLASTPKSMTRNSRRSLRRPSHPKPKVTGACEAHPQADEQQAERLVGCHITLPRVKAKDQPAEVLAYDRHKGKHQVQYTHNGRKAWLDLAKEPYILAPHDGTEHGLAQCMQHAQQQGAAGAGGAAAAAWAPPAAQHAQREAACGGAASAVAAPIIDIHAPVADGSGALGPIAAVTAGAVHTRPDADAEPGATHSADGAPASPVHGTVAAAEAQHGVDHSMEQPEGLAVDGAPAVPTHGTVAAVGLDDETKHETVEQPEGSAVVERRIRVWWPLEKQFFLGRVLDFDTVKGTHFVRYDDSDEEELVLATEQWHFCSSDDTPDPSTNCSAASDADSPGGNLAAASDAESPGSSTSHGSGTSCGRSGSDFGCDSGGEGKPGEWGRPGRLLGKRHGNSSYADEEPATRGKQSGLTGNRRSGSGSGRKKLTALRTLRGLRGKSQRSSERGAAEPTKGRQQPESERKRTSRRSVKHPDRSPSLRDASECGDRLLQEEGHAADALMLGMVTSPSRSDDGRPAAPGAGARSANDPIQASAPAQACSPLQTTAQHPGDVSAEGSPACPGLNRPGRPNAETTTTHADGVQSIPLNAAGRAEEAVLKRSDGKHAAGAAVEPASSRALQAVLSEKPRRASAGDAMRSTSGTALLNVDHGHTPAGITAKASGAALQSLLGKRPASAQPKSSGTAPSGSAPATSAAALQRLLGQEASSSHKGSRSAAAHALQQQAIDQPLPADNAEAKVYAGSRLAPPGRHQDSVHSGQAAAQRPAASGGLTALLGQDRHAKPSASSKQHALQPRAPQRAAQHAQRKRRRPNQPQQRQGRQRQNPHKQPHMEHQPQPHLPQQVEPLHQPGGGELAEQRPQELAGGREAVATERQQRLPLSERLNTPATRGGHAGQPASPMYCGQDRLAHGQPPVNPHAGPASSAPVHGTSPATSPARSHAEAKLHHVGNGFYTELAVALDATTQAESAPISASPQSYQPTTQLHPARSPHNTPVQADITANNPSTTPAHAQQLGGPTEGTPHTATDATLTAHAPLTGQQPVPNASSADKATVPTLPAEAASLQAEVAPGQRLAVGQVADLLAARSHTEALPGQHRTACHIAVSGLDKPQLEQLKQFCASMDNARTGVAVNADTTHLIVQMGEDRLLLKRTLKYFQAVLRGCWVVGWAWLQACIQAGEWVAEEPYECRGDDVYLGAPSHARLQRSHGSPGIFAGWRICLVDPWTGPLPKSSLAELISLGGGQVIAVVPKRSAQSRHAHTPQKLVAVTTCDAHAEQPDHQQLAIAKKHARQAPLVIMNWVLDSIRSSAALDFKEFAL